MCNLENFFITIFFWEKISEKFGKIRFSKFWAPNMSQNRLGIFFWGLLRKYQNFCIQFPENPGQTGSFPTLVVRSPKTELEITK